MTLTTIAIVLQFALCSLVLVTGFVQQHPSASSCGLGGSLLSSSSSSTTSSTTTIHNAATKLEDDANKTIEAAAAVEVEGSDDASNSSLKLFNEFALFLQKKQLDIINDIEELEKESGNIENKFSNDCWGVFAEEDESEGGSGGRTRVIQKGNIVEKGACSFTLIKGGKLTKERAESIRGRNANDSNGNINIKEGDTYYAAALSMVLHTRSPMVPTFRSDVRIFLVESTTTKSGEGESETKTLAWFGGGSDLTPYYLFDDDIMFFHQQLYHLCTKHSDANDMIDYKKMKIACDDYFFLPARNEQLSTVNH